LLAAALGACAAPVQTATGVVVAVDSPSIGRVDEVTVRTDDGQVVRFDVRRLDINNGLPAQHLNEHLASGIPIVVEYVVEGGRNVALRYNDAPAEPGSS
jgi:hypothetical protein